MAYVLVWEFVVREGAEAAFESAYGPDGDWAKLFSRSPGHIRTELVRDTGNPLRYLTFDSWTSMEDCEEFHRCNEAEYKNLDERCETLTMRETQIGTFLTTEPHRRTTSA